MTSISNEECVTQYSYNLTNVGQLSRHSSNASQVESLCKAIPDGFFDGMFCTKGIYDENENRTNVYGNKVTGETCKGDSGGPFITKNGDGRMTLAGITSGWYRVGSHHGQSCRVRGLACAAILLHL